MNAYVNQTVSIPRNAVDLIKTLKGKQSFADWLRNDPRIKGHLERTMTRLPVKRKGYNWGALTQEDWRRGVEHVATVTGARLSTVAAKMQRRNAIIKQVLPG